MHVLDQLQKLIKAEGQKCLLPQNLPDNILQRIDEEATAIEEEKDDPAPSALLLAVMTLKDKNLMAGGGQIEFTPEELMRDFFAYGVSARLEILRREEKLHTDKKSLPTLDNILDFSRTIDISGLD